MDTRGKILQATIQLIVQKGFKASTTRAIAENAGVNEVTLFRHFGNKRGLMKAVIEQFSYVPAFTKAFRENLVWDLGQDLLMLAKLYHKVMNHNRDLVIIMMNLKEAGDFPELEQQIVSMPRQLKKGLSDYLIAMKEKGKLVETDIEAQVMAFIYMNFGFFFTRTRFGTQITELTEDDFLASSLKTYVRGLTPKLNSGGMQGL